MHIFEEGDLAIAEPLDAFDERTQLITRNLDRSKERGPCRRGMALARRAGAWVDIHDRQVIGDQRRWISR